METSPYYQSASFNKAKGTITDLPNCTCFCQCRSYEALELASAIPMFSGYSTGGYPNAKNWYDKTTFPKGKELKTGSIAVFDGNFGHVAFVEQRIDSNHAIISQSQYDDNKSLRNYKYYESRECELTIGKATLSGVGKLIGFIYLPINDIRTERDATRDQLQIVEDMVNVRIAPNGDLFQKGCYIPTGIYNALESRKVDGYYWYKVEDNHWVREGEWLKFYPGIEEDTLIKENRELKEQNEALMTELALKNDMLDEIRNIVC